MEFAKSDDDPFADYPVGSILRIRLKDFLTYSFVEFDCGPSFNFVLGPNGSGKSSLVCAICLGLAGDVKTLFRATKLEGFIRHGCSRGSVEIELKGERAGQTHVIKRTLTGNLSEWKLNGQKSTHKEVEALIRSLHIEIDNLCNFLPQERVHAFAQLSPTDRLKETMSTIGGADMVKKFESLGEFRLDEKSLDEMCTREEGEVNTLVRRNQLIEPDVQRFLERDEIIRRISVLEKKKPWIEYNHARDIYIGTKEERKAAARELTRLENVNAPLIAKIDDCKKKLEEQEGMKKEFELTQKKMEKTLEKSVKNIQTMADAMEETESSIKGIQDEVRKRRANIRNCEHEIREIEQKLAEGDPSEELQECQAVLNEKSAALRVKTQEGNDLSAEYDEHAFRANEVQQNGTAISERLKALRSVKQARMRILRGWSAHSYQAAQWVSNNRELFQAQVFDPIMTEINVKNPRYADAVENVLGARTQLLFVVQNQHDYEVFTREIKDKQKLNVNVTQLSHLRMRDFEPKISKEQLNRLGFEGVISELIEAPEPIMVAICEYTRAHMIPFAEKSVPENPSEWERLGIQQHISGGYRVSSKRSRYGDRAWTTRNTKIQAARNLLNQIDTSEEGRLQAEFDTLAAQYKSLKNEIERLTALKAANMREQEDARAEKDEWSTRKAALAQRLSAYRRLGTKKQTVLDRLEALKADTDSHQQEKKLYTKLKKLACERAQLIVKLKDQVQKSVDILSDGDVIHLQMIQLQLQIDWLTVKCREQSDAFRAAEQAYQEVNQRFAESKKRAQDLLARARQLGEPDEELQRKFDELPATLDELDALLVRERARAEMNLDTDERVLREYNSRKALIEKQSAQLGEKKARLAKIRSDMEAIRSEWEPTLDLLITRISERFSIYFERLGCAGQVRVAKNDDYDKWGIEILVKFRDAEQLAPLTAHRQSGGERSVSIILYLMSLQHFSKAPFRVVDEINQGMDPRNERLIHTQIVRTICDAEDVVQEQQPNGVAKRPNSQYFLITPKLLPDLMYHEKMRILVVYNGEHVPDKKSWPSCNSQSWLKDVAAVAS